MRPRRTDYPPLSPEAAAAVAQLGEVLRSVPKVAEWAAHGGNVIAIYERPGGEARAAKTAKQRERRRVAKERYRAKLRAAGAAALTGGGR